jgi:molecular chaperone DnaK (HSP70)
MWLGIDFGTCLSSAALMIDNNVRLVKDPDQSGFSIPSSVYVTESGEIRIGHAAENLRRQNPSFYRREFKRDLGTTNPYILGNRELSPEELAAEVIKELKKEADEMIRGRGLLPIDNAVITVPATYQLHKRNLMELAGKKAGFQQVKLLEEPVAAAVYYTNYNRRKEEQYQEENILVYDLGGGTFDATLIQKTKNKYEILSAPVGLTHCGGIDFDRKIFDDIYKRCSSQLRELLNRHNRTPDAELGRLLVSDFCRQFKHKLGREREHKDILDAGNIPYEEYSLSRDAFNSMISPLIAETIEQCNRLVESAGIGWDAVNQVLLVGGSCRIPYVKTVVEKEFKRPVFLVDDPELAVCQGAAIYAVNELSPPPPAPPAPPPPPPPNGKTKSTQWDYFYSL